MGMLAECFEVAGGVPGKVLADRMGCLKAAVSSPMSWCPPGSTSGSLATTGNRVAPRTGCHEACQREVDRVFQGLEFPVAVPFGNSEPQ